MTEVSIRELQDLLLLFWALGLLVGFGAGITTAFLELVPGARAERYD